MRPGLWNAFVPQIVKLPLLNSEMLPKHSFWHYSLLLQVLLWGNGNRGWLLFFQFGVSPQRKSSLLYPSTLLADISTPPTHTHTHTRVAQEKRHELWSQMQVPISTLSLKKCKAIGKSLNVLSPFFGHLHIVCESFLHNHSTTLSTHPPSHPGGYKFVRQVEPLSCGSHLESAYIRWTIIFQN